MITSSVFVLTALTMTGIYMKDRSVEEQDDGYTIDFTALEDNAEDKANEIAQNSVQEEAEIGSNTPNVMEDDLDYYPMEEVDSGNIEIPGITDGATQNANNTTNNSTNSATNNGINSTVGGTESSDESAVVDGDSELIGEQDTTDALTQELTQEATDALTEGETNLDTEEQTPAVAENVEVLKALSFTQEQGLTRPVAGTILIPFSMDKTVYFTTLDQYKYNAAVIYSIPEKTNVVACADGKIVSIFDDEEIGHAVTIDLGNGYQVTYGQLQNVQLSEGSYINRGENIGTIAAPTKYYSLEGANLYFQLEKDGIATNPEILMN